MTTQTTSTWKNSRAWLVAKEFGAGAMVHDLMTLSAALAFYTALSLAPLLLILLSVVGLMGASSQTELISQIQSSIGPQAAEAIRVIVENADNRPQLGSWAGIVGVLTLLFSASGVFAQLQSSLNVIWQAEGAASDAGVGEWLRKRLLSMGMVLAFGFIAAVSLALSAVLSFVFQSDGQLWQIVNYGVSLAVFAFLFALIFEYLPDRRLPFREALIGGALTSVLFSIGKSLIGLYLGRSAVGSAYGAAGSLLVLLVWVYYSALIVFIGAELTRALHALKKAAPAYSPEAAVEAEKCAPNKIGQEPIIN